MGGWRSLFDPYCDEWQYTDIQAKVGFIKYLMNYVTFNELIDLWLNTEQREYIINDLPDAIRKLSTYLPDAAEYFKLKIYTE